ncbi:MAG: MarR family transcriptional regulator [Acidimicrobiia bacterium]
MPADMERAERAAAAIRRATTRFQRRLRLEAPQHGLAPAKLSVLGLLRRARQPMTPGELATADGVHPQTMTRVLAELEESGLVTRARDANDARQFHIALTAAGDSALDADVRQRDRWLAGAMVRELSPTERKVLHLAADLMERVSDLDRAFVRSESDTSGVPGTGAVPVLPTHDTSSTIAFYQRLGFMNARGGDDGYAMLERDGIELHFTLRSDVDPFSAAGIARLSVPDADAFRDEILAAGVTLADPAADLPARWASERDISRVGRITDKPYRVREFALFDPTNNLILVGHPIGLNRQRTIRRTR